MRQAPPPTPSRKGRGISPPPRAGGGREEGAGPARITSLDSLRGIAALAVVLHHLWLLGAVQPVTPWQWRLLRYTPLNIIVEGRQPVILFFVLSGFVLAHALMQAPTPYPIFTIRRVLRIYLPFAAAILLSGACYALLDPGEPRPFSAWFGGLWRGGYSLSRLAGHLLMPGTRRDDLDPVVWSLVHEFRISALLPVLLWSCQRRLGTMLAASVVVQWLVLPFCLDPITGEPCRAWLSCRPFWGAGADGSLLVSAYFVCFFVLGIGIAVQRERLHQLFRNPHCKTLGVAVSLALLSGVAGTGDLGFGLGGALLIVLALESGRLATALRRRPLPWLGRISYSLYLVHVPVFLAGIYGLGPGLQPRWQPALLPVLPALALIAACLFYRLVEIPAQHVGRRLTAHPFAAGAASAKARA